MSVVLLGAMLAGATAATAAVAETPDKPVVWYFWGDGCPHCEAQKPHVEAWRTRYPELEFRSLEVWHDVENRAIFVEQAGLRGVEPQGVPATFIGQAVFLGFHESGLSAMEASLDALAAGAARPTDGPMTTLPLLGEVETGSRSLVALTAMIGFVDGFNPCSLWVLSVLLAMIVRSGSRRNVLIVGLTFLGVTATVYGLFVAGVYSAMSYVAYLGWVRVGVAVLALAYGAVNVKDYFLFKRGVSFTIPERRMPGIYRQARSVMSPDRSTAAMVAATAAMAVGVSALELACTAGFPVLWGTILAERGVQTPEFVGLLGIYMAIYLLDELALFGVVVVSMRVTRLQERHGRGLKLVGGTLMLALAVTLLVAPQAMDSVTGSATVFAVAVAAAGVLALLGRTVHRVPVRPQ
jgi:thiol-disulfide isomerase/thioredoxin